MLSKIKPYLPIVVGVAVILFALKYVPESIKAQFRY